MLCLELRHCLIACTHLCGECRQVTMWSSSPGSCMGRVASCLNSPELLANWICLTVAECSKSLGSFSYGISLALKCKLQLREVILNNCVSLCGLWTIISSGLPSSVILLVWTCIFSLVTIATTPCSTYLCKIQLVKPWTVAMEISSLYKTDLSCHW